MHQIKLLVELVILLLLKNDGMKPQNPGQTWEAVPPHHTWIFPPEVKASPPCSGAAGVSGPVGFAQVPKLTYLVPDLEF